MTAFEIVERKLREGMVKGAMHTCLRNIGRLAGGYAASGQLPSRDLTVLEDIAAGLSVNPKEGRLKWREAVSYGRSEPVKLDAPRQERAIGFGWDDPVIIGKADR